MTAPAPAAAAERMSTLDAEFFFAEHANVPLHIGSVAVFDGPAPSREDLMQLSEAKTLHDLRVAEVVKQDLHLEEGGRITFRTKLELSFKYEHEH